MSDELLNKILDKLDNMDNRLKGMESRQDEMYTILKGLEERANTSSAELDKINNKIINIEGNTKILEKAETKKFLKTGSKIVSLLSEV